MDKNFNIKDYQENVTNVTINNYEKIKTIILLKLSGDTVIFVVWKNGTYKYFDSSNTRMYDFTDDTSVFSPKEFSQKDIDEFEED